MTLHSHTLSHQSTFVWLYLTALKLPASQNLVIIKVYLYSCVHTHLYACVFVHMYVHVCVSVCVYCALIPMRYYGYADHQGTYAIRMYVYTHFIIINIFTI